MFERFTDAARQVVLSAQEEARELGHPFIGAEHLLLGVARTDPELLAVDEGRLRGRVVAAVGSSMKLVEGTIPFTAAARSAIEHALGVALARGDRHIGPTQLLLALLEQQPIEEIVRAAGAAPEELFARLAPVAPPPPRDDMRPGDHADARMLLDILRRGGRVAAWLREHGIEESEVRSRYG